MISLRQRPRYIIRVFEEIYIIAEFGCCWIVKKRNKRYGPRETVVCNTRDIFSTLFGLHENIIMRSYVAENKKSVIILSIMHHDKVTSEPKQKCEMVVFSQAKIPGRCNG